MPLDRARARRLILAAVAAGLVARLAFGLLYWTGKPLTHDEREYLALADSVAAGRGFTYDAAHETGTAHLTTIAKWVFSHVDARGATASPACG